MPVSRKGALERISKLHRIFKDDLSMATMRNLPWAVVSQLQDDINRVFGNFSESESSSATAGWIPAVDVFEYSDRFELLIDLPGVDPKEVEITLDNGVLTLSGERRQEPQASEGAVQQERCERRQGRFHRRFILPDTADAENVEAAGRNGVLAIRIKKHAKAQPRRISVR
jgi:HSP20 family protein